MHEKATQLQTNIQTIFIKNYQYSIKIASIIQNIEIQLYKIKLFSHSLVYRLKVSVKFNNIFKISKV